MESFSIKQSSLKILTMHAKYIRSYLELFHRRSKTVQEQIIRRIIKIFVSEHRKRFHHQPFLVRRTFEHRCTAKRHVSGKAFKIGFSNHTTLRHEISGGNINSRSVTDDLKQVFVDKGSTFQYTISTPPRPRLGFGQKKYLWTWLKSIFL